LTWIEAGSAERRHLPPVFYYSTRTARRQRVVHVSNGNTDIFDVIANGAHDVVTRAVAVVDVKFNYRRSYVIARRYIYVSSSSSFKQVARSADRLARGLESVDNL